MQIDAAVGRSQVFLRRWGGVRVPPTRFGLLRVHSLGVKGSAVNPCLS